MTKELLHKLIDRLPESELDEVEHLLRLRTDPVYRAAMEAPEDDEPETPEETAAVAEARADFAAGRVVSHAEARRRLLGES